MRRSSKHGRLRHEHDTIRIQGRMHRVIDEMRIRTRRYLVLRRLSAKPRQRYLVWDPNTGPGGEFRCLLILPKSQATDQHVRVLKRLPQTLAELPRVMDYECSRHETRIVLTWVRGVELDEYIQRILAGKVDRPTPFHAVRLMRGLAHALAAMHTQAQLLHADLKPVNLILTRKSSRLLMIDFGSAWPLGQTGFRCAGDGVNLVYSSPESQMAQSFVDARADQFSASVILYQLMTLKPEFWIRIAVELAS